MDMKIPLPKFTMPIAGLILTITIICLGIFDLVMVLFTGTGSSISSFLVAAGIRSPVFAFSLGFVAGHCLGYMVPLKNEPTTT